MQSRESVINQKADATVLAADSLNMSAIFAMFLQETWTRFLEESARFFMFPFAALAGVIRSILAWRQAKLENGKNGTIVKAVIETLGTLAVTTAVIGGFVAASIFAAISPIIFTVTLAAKAIYHAGSAIYYWGKASATDPIENPDKKTKYTAMAKSHAVGAVALSLLTPAVALVMILAKPIFAILGIVGGIIGTAYAVYKAVSTPTPTRGNYQLILNADNRDNREYLNNVSPSHRSISSPAVSPLHSPGSRLNSPTDKRIVVSAPSPISSAFRSDHSPKTATVKLNVPQIDTHDANLSSNPGSPNSRRANQVGHFHFTPSPTFQNNREANAGPVETMGRPSNIKFFADVSVASTPDTLPQNESLDTGPKI